ncbi:AAA family ATPase [Aquincola tertiaricarbonis]|uniref:histidine kinase n=1 Tax=Aquincola tertiaricarbonis TaxID=391953 RepID=A0ABY4S307_AQUTE|nr:ATP-binding protein [Aquincola tertiaricarbonis]URI06585.1 AAA family ATPase [Aquincola tertiaricarbonis]
MPSLNWRLLHEGSTVVRACDVGWSSAERGQRQRLRRHALLSAAVDGAGAPRPTALQADAGGLHYRESLHLDHWPATLQAQARTDRPAPRDELLTLALAIGRVLHGLERSGIVHGRLAPETVLWQPLSGQAWLTDFDRGGFLRVQESAQGRLRATTDLVALGALLSWRLSGQRHWLQQDGRPASAAQLAPLIELAPDPLLRQVLLALWRAGGPGGYRSAQALCEALVQGAPRTSPAALGRPPCWHLPQERIGRTHEVEQMLQAFAAVERPGGQAAGSAGPPLLAIVEGRSGIGKTAVTQAACHTMQDLGARVAAGKFNQYGSQSPLAPLLEALDAALADCGRLASSARAAVATAIEAELGAMAGVLSPALPWLAQLIGPQPPAPELGGDASRIRFELALRRLVVALSAGAEPLVLFIDDLQWADPRSLALLDGLLSEPRMGRLLVLGAFRSEAIDEGHALHRWLHRLSQQPGIDLRRLQIQPWSAADIARLLATAEVGPDQPIDSAAGLLLQQGEGNPFMTLQLLRAAEQFRAITPDAEDGGWRIDLARLQALSAHRTPADLVQARLQGLPEATQATLSDAAHLGAAWSVDSLAAGRGGSVLQVCRDLAPALAAGLLLPTDDEPACDETLTIRFLHDAVQQAAYERVDQGRRDALRVRLGTGLLQHAVDEGRLNQYLFTIVQQFNDVQQTPAGGLDAATATRLNERAGQLASAKGATDEALKYFLRAVQASRMHLGEATSEHRQALYRRAAEAACAAARFDVADELIDQAAACRPDALESARLDELRLLTLLARNRLAEALQLGQQTLDALGVPLMTLGDDTPWPPVPHQAPAAGTPGSHPRVDCAHRVLVALTPCAFITSFEMYARVIRTMIGLAMQWPASDWTALAWTNYGLTLCGMGQPPAAFDAGELALSMLGRLQHPPLACKVRVLCLGFLRHWRLPLQQQLQPLLQAYEDCQVAGDQEYLGYAAFLYCDKAFGMAPLDELLAGHGLRTRTVQQFGHDFSHHHCRVWLQGLRALRGDPEAQPLRLDGPAFQEEEELARLAQAQNAFSLFTAHTLRALLAWHRGDGEACWQACQQALPLAANGTATVLSIDLLVLASLSAPAGAGQAHRDQLATWARAAPANVAHKLQLVDAVLAARGGRMTEALALFDSAREGAQAGGFLRDQVLIEQACSEALLDTGQRDATQHWFSLAWASGLRWGALAVVERLLARHAQRMAALEPAPPSNGKPTGRTIDLARVSHDMRTPLGGVMGLTAMLLASNLNERQRRLAMLTKASAESLLGLVNDIMDLGELEHGQLRLHIAPVPLQPLVQALVELFQLQHSSGRVELRAQIDEQVPDSLDTDGQRLRQVLTNLVGNAFKFTRQGHIRLHVGRSGATGHDAVRFSVTDTGTGIAADEQQHIFKAFYQSTSGAAHTASASSGMGLAVCKGIVEAMGGRIGFDSTLGVGSCFWFELPLAPHARQGQLAH